MELELELYPARVLDLLLRITSQDKPLLVVSKHGGK